MSTFVYKRTRNLTLIKIDGVELQGYIGNIEISGKPGRPPEITIHMVPTEGWEIAFTEANINFEPVQLEVDPEEDKPVGDKKHYYEYTYPHTLTPVDLEGDPKHEL